MDTTFLLNADELDEQFLQGLKQTFAHRQIETSAQNPGRLDSTSNWTSVLSLLPILPQQIGHSAEFIRVMGDQSELATHSNCGDHKVIWADQIACSLQVSAYSAITLRCGIIERQRNK